MVIAQQAAAVPGFAKFGLLGRGFLGAHGGLPGHRPSGKSPSQKWWMNH